MNMRACGSDWARGGGSPRGWGTCIHSPSASFRQSQASIYIYINIYKHHIHRSQVKPKTERLGNCTQPKYRNIPLARARPLIRFRDLELFRTSSALNCDPSRTVTSPTLRGDECKFPPPFPFSGVSCSTRRFCFGRALVGGIFLVGS